MAKKLSLANNRLAPRTVPLLRPSPWLGASSGEGQGKPCKTIPHSSSNVDLLLIPPVRQAHSLPAAAVPVASSPI